MDEQVGGVRGGEVRPPPPSHRPQRERRRLLYALGDLEDPQQTEGPEHADPERHPGPEESPHHLEDTAHNHLQDTSTASSL